MEWDGVGKRKLQVTVERKGDRKACGGWRGR